MTWISVEHTTPDKPEVFCMAERLGIDPDEVVGKLIRLWVWADTQTYNGDADAMVSRMLIDRKAGLKGFADAMEAAGWLNESDDGRLSFPNFGDHNGETAKTRKQNAKRQAKHRKNKESGDVSRSQRDRTVTPTVTTEQYRTEQYKTPSPKLITSVSGGSSPKGPTADSSGGWDLISEKLRDAGVVAFRAAVRDAQRNGWTIQHAAAVVEFWASRDELQGGLELRQRFEESGDMPPNEGWPTLAGRKVAKAKSRTKVDKVAEETAARLAERRARTAELDKARRNGEAMTLGHRNRKKGQGAA